MIRTLKFATTLAVAIQMTTVVAGPYDGWKPHKYCNAIENIEETNIQPLNDAQKARVASLEQVQVIARHGGRAPYARLPCWDDKHHNPMKAEWTCTATSVSSQVIDVNPETGFGRLYKKTYMHGLNILPGNCVVGGLLPIGRRQHLKNGEFLRAAYIGEGPLKIFPHANLSDLPYDRIYLRSDDQERTIGSGQALVDGIFPPDGTMSESTSRMLNWFVADMATDHVNTNEAICPMMGYVGGKSGGSAPFQAHINSKYVKTLENDFTKLVGNFSWNTVLECLSTARCNDLPLPDGVDEEMFTNVFREVENRQAIFLTWNESWYARTAMQPLMSELFDTINLALHDKPLSPKLAITMGHDSTLMPLLAAILRNNWDRKWTPYAGMAIFETYKTTGNSHAIRLLFKGKPQLIPGCADTLCDIESFRIAISFGRTRRNCTAPKEESLSASSETFFGLPRYWTYGTLIALAIFGAMMAVRYFRRHSNSSDEEKRGLLG